MDAGYDSAKTRDLLDTLGRDYVISKRGTPLQTGIRWVVERTDSWHTRGFRKFQICTEVRTRVINAFIAVAAVIIIIRRLIRDVWARYRWGAKRP